MLKKFLTLKAKGNITSLIFGQMFILLLTIWCLFSFRLTMLNASFNYIDDALTNSILGGALVNVEEYGLSNQLIIYDSDNLNEVQGNTLIRGWEQWEADILLSEYNEGNDFGMYYTYDVLEWKQEVDTLSRSDTNEAYLDYFLRQSVSAFSGNFNYNITNGKYNSNIDVETKIPSLNKSVDLNKALTVTIDEINDTFLNGYVSSDVTVSRFEIYNVYKRTFAQKHYYKSEYISWNGNTPTWIGPKTDAEFETYFSNIANNAELNGFDGIEINEYKAHVKNIWAKDLQAFNERASSGKLILFTDTGITYQGPYSDELYGFDYLYVNSSTADLITEGEKADATGYSVYRYLDNGDTYSTQYKYTEFPSLINNKIVIEDGTMAGVEIENTSLYIELTFKVKTFPGSLDSVAPEKEVTVSRLIDIEIASE